MSIKLWVSLLMHKKIDRSTYEIFLIAVLNLMDIKLILIKNQRFFFFFILRKNLEVRDLML